MFEAHVLYLLRKYLGEYVQGLSIEALRISVWKGDVVLKDLQLKAEALNSLNLPVTVKAGFVGTITLKVPWKSLGKEPVIVLIDRVFVLAHPAPDGHTVKEEDREKLFEAKLKQIEEAESATLEAKSKRSSLGNPAGGNSWLGSLIGTIIGNLKISISNVHIRYEDTVSNPGHPFCSGVTLAKLAAVTTDGQGNETFDTSGVLDKLRKSLQLQRLAVYHDSDFLPWKLDKNWEDLSPKEWIEIFEDGINESALASVWASNRKYLVSPINGVLKYHRLGKQERTDPEIPFETASLVLRDVTLTISEAQYRDGIKLYEVFSRYRMRVDVSHLRPVVPVSVDPYVWWRYAANAGVQQKKMCYRFSWDRIQHLCQLRRRYIQLYASSLQQLSNVDKSEIRLIEKDLDSKVILLWRLLAHAKVESVKSKEAAQQRVHMKKSWWSFGWRTSSVNLSSVSDTEESQKSEERLTKEEWHAINKLLSYQPDEEIPFLAGKDMQNMIQFLVNVSIEQAAARIININQTEIVCGRFEQLKASSKFYHRTILCDLSLRFYGLLAPEGSLAESVSSETKVNALAASFVHSPIGENVDWRLSATIAPCHVTVLMESYDRFLEFVKRSNAVSPTLALETANALQMKIEKVTRRAQEQFQMVLEEQSRFALDIDFDAPKVTVPMKTSASPMCPGYFLLDFGHFTLHTKEGQCDEQRQSLYSRFCISGRDFTAFFVDASSDSVNSTLLPSLLSGQPSLPACGDAHNFYSLIDRCGMSVIIDQIKLQHLSYPSTRVSVQVPNLGIHFSPERYRRITDLLSILYSPVESSNHATSENLQHGNMSWYPADLTANARILVWRGIGNSIAEWQPCFLVLYGVYLYVLDSEISQGYQRCLGMAGRQVIEVSPASVGGSLFSIAVCFRGVDVQKALESSNTLIIEFRDDEEKATWLKELIQATYRASAPASIGILDESGGNLPEYNDSQVNKFKTADLVVKGALLESRLLVYGKTGEEKCEIVEETLILEILAGGGKINLIRLGGDLTAKMKLQSLKIKDELQGRLSASPQYLACSVQEDAVTNFSTLDPNGKDLHKIFFDEDDIFKDALPDFMPAPDPSFYSQNPDFLYNTKLGSLDSDGSAGIVSSNALLNDNDLVKGRNMTNEIFYEAPDNDICDFVAVTFLTRHPGSPLYDGIDTQMSIRMSKLEFFCNRPTLVALIGFGFDLSTLSSGSGSSQMNISSAESSQDKEKTEDNGRSFVKGLLGYGKGRVVFYLSMDIDSVCIFLNKEDGSQLAMLVQESFLLDLKIYPSSISIEGTLGNLRLCDMSIGVDHCWGWLCDIRNQGAESLVKFKFQSYSTDDDDYEGHDYSLQGRLSAVRIVFLYKFVQEITAYFMELGTPHTEEAIRFVDKVGGFEWLIQKYEIEGASAIKLDLSLDTPIIVVPKNSTSKDFMQLDLGKLHVRNNFTWHGNGEDDPSAVHLDVLHAEIQGINMAVGINGVLGKPMIRQGQGVHIEVRRSLRDVFRKVPTLYLQVQVGLLHGVVSDKEYDVILNCLYMNLSEEHKLPPSFRGNTVPSKDSVRLLADKVNLHSQMILSRTVVIVVAEVNYALLELCNGIDEESPLAHIALEGLWVSHRTTSLYETDLYVTIPKFSILDIRPDTKPEMRLMLGSSSDVLKQGIYGISGSSGNPNTSFADSGSLAKSLEAASDVDIANLTMLLMDYRIRSSSKSFVLRIQQPRVLVVLDFLLAVGEFFVPALGAITGREEILDPKNDPITKNNNIVLSTPIYKQIDDVVHLSSNRQLIVDGFGIDEFTYDGCGGTVCLSLDVNLKETSSSEIQPIIIIGRGKTLRFKNVKIENGGLLRKCTYLSNDSRYSVSEDDGVEISLLKDVSSEIDPTNMEPVQVSSDHSTSPVQNISASSQTQSFTFEAQVVYSEFTFYDSTKSSVDDSLHSEKLLRAKLDLSFMYAAKESDTWVRALVKDLTVEAGSGLVILDPVDISGGYTSVNDKTNISVISSDVHVHLSLSVISLVLHWQNQAAEALQFGHVNPLASCTNFDQLWVSQKGNGSEYDLAFWRPRAPSNYAILGDCVTSRPVPPSQTVMAVSNSYGRVRKPLGFQLIGLFSSFRGSEGYEDEHNGDNECSLWLPIAPAGYSTLGCVANIGKEPPPNHIVYCIRSDLITAAGLSDCIFTVPPNPRYPTGFSIWRFDNAIGSFYAHSAVEYPPKIAGCDLHQILFGNPSLHLYLTDKENSGPSVNNDYTSQKGSNHGSSSGWDVIRSISKASSYYMSTPHFERIWWDKGSVLRRPVSIWRPVPRLGFFILGDCIVEGLEPPALGLVFKYDSSGISAKPVQFTKVAHITGKGLDEAFFWYPIAPPGYASLGCIVSRTDEAPHMDSFCCPRMDLVTQANISEGPISWSSNTKGSQSWSIWKVENQACTFLARSDFKKPSSRLAYSIGDYVMPKTRENVSAEMKLQCFSLTVLDSLCGMMTPIFDTTITNINLATHGQLKSMNAVLISSIAASTFNTQLEAWEPLVEPFDGIFKFETYDTSVSLQPRVGKRVRIAATSTLNLNISAANLEAFTEAMISWRRQEELEEKSTTETGHQFRSSDATFSALEDDDFQKVIVENKLGCDIYLKKVEQNTESVELLHHGDAVSAWLLPPHFSERLNVVAESREARCYIAIQILECKGLPILDDGNSHEFFCALRLVIDGQPSDQQKLFPQSARTRCIKPLISKTSDLDEGNAKWNELFIFEIPRKGLANLEVEVTNLASKAGKGEVVGAFSIAVGNCGGKLKRAASASMLHKPVDVNNVSSYALKKRGRLTAHDVRQDCGCLLVSTFYFEKKTIVNFQKDMGITKATDRDVGFWVGLGPEGPWEGFKSLLPLSVVPKTLNENFFAFEVTMKNGKKHAIFRSLAVVINDADVPLEVSICPASLLDNHTSLTLEPNNCPVVTEEVFENQRYQPISGWGNKWPGFRGSDPGRWSTRNLSYSSKDFFEPPLPPRWQWTSSWMVEKSQFVDADGWAYGADYQSLKWPPTSPKSRTKSTLDFVRRRRWVRTRQQVPEKSPNIMRNVVAVIEPRSSAVLPWRSMAMDSDMCLQVRPYVEYPQVTYTWGHIVTVGSGQSGVGDQSSVEQHPLHRQNTIKSGVSSLPNGSFKLNQLEKKDVLIYCNSSTGSKQQYVWLSIGTDASVHHTELNTPIYDWKISINSPIKIENRLPCQADYAVWERAREGHRVERQHGIITSGSSAFIYSADIRKSVYLTLFLQGGWVLEKDAIPILNLSALDHVSSFWMVHQQSHRSLRVSIERDLGGTNAAPKHIRLFVPYWIANDTSLLLAYRVVEVEPLDNVETDSLSVSRAVKSAKLALKRPSNSADGRNPSSRRNIQILETIEDISSIPVMLSPQDYINRSGILQFSSQSDAFLSPRVGIAVAIRHSEHYSPGISLLELENKERVDVKAFNANGSYYKLSALLTMTSNRTKVVHFQPQTVFINRIGHNLCLQQCGTRSVECLRPTDYPKMLLWQSTSKTELLKLRVDGFKWSMPFSIENEGVMCASLKSDVGGDQMYVKIDIRSGTKSSRYEVVFRPVSFSSPFRIENRSIFLPIHFRQAGGLDDSWRSLAPNAAASFFWEDLGRQRLLEVFVDGTDPLKSQKYNIDQISDYKPTLESGGPVSALRVTIRKEGMMHVVKIADWMPANETVEFMPRRLPLTLPHPSEVEYNQSTSASDCEFHVIVELAELGISVIDHTPEEILYLSLQNLLLSYSTGLGSGISRFKLRMLGIQLDNQLPLTPMPVLFRPQRVTSQLDYIIKLSVNMQSNGTLDFCIYPYVGLQGPDNVAFLVKIHEPIIWRLHEMIQQVNLSSLSGAPTTVSVDPIIQIGLLNISEIRFKVTLAMSPTQRPRGVLGFWSSLMTALGNTENMPVRINQRFHEVCMRQSTLISSAISNVQKDLLSQPLQLLSGVDILGNASSALGHMSKGVAALSMDKKFIQSRQRQENKGVEDIGDVIREGGGALAKGLFRGVTGILTKPIEGAKSSGVEGFVQGVGKGLIGAAAQPVSGVLDLLSKTTEGANAVRMKIMSAITSEEQLLRRRLPRVIGGDNLLRPYDEYKAQGQVILHLAESGTFFGQVDLFKVRGKFALSDAYEDHFLLPKGKIVIVTHRRVLLLQQPSNVMAQKRFNPARDPCSVLWDVLWDDLHTMELTHGKKENPRSSPPSRLVLYSQARPADSKDYIHVIKCSHDTQQAEEIFSSITRAMNTFGPNHIKGTQKKMVPKPYSPRSSCASSEDVPKECGIWETQHAPQPVPLSSTFGTELTQPQTKHEVQK